MKCVWSKSRTSFSAHMWKYFFVYFYVVSQRCLIYLLRFWREILLHRLTKLMEFAWPYGCLFYRKVFDEHIRFSKEVYCISSYQRFNFLLVALVLIFHYLSVGPFIHYTSLEIYTLRVQLTNRTRQYHFPNFFESLWPRLQIENVFYIKHFSTKTLTCY